MSLIQEVLENLVQRRDLRKEEVSSVMEEIMEGLVTPSQLAAYLTALRCKGETVQEIATSAMVMRRYAKPVNPKSRPLVDTCGTGGDGQMTFNISTTAAFVVAGGGLKVAKHGNRSVSSRSGSADVLEELGVNLALSPDKVEESIDEVGMGFLFAPQLHPAMAHALLPRKEMGIRTIFNLLGPLTNPASSEYQVLGVYDRDLVLPLALVLKELGVSGALVFHGAHGLDELSTTGRNQVVQLKEGAISQWSFLPEDVGLQKASLKEIQGGTPRENACLTREVLSGQEGAPQDIVLLNAAGAFLVTGMVSSLKEGLLLAKEVIISGKAMAKLEDLIAFSQGSKT